MLLRVQSHLHYTAAQPCSVLLQIETAQDRTSSGSFQQHHTDLQPSGGRARRHRHAQM